MANTQDLPTLVDQMPDPDRRGMYTENIDQEQIDQAIAGICNGGAKSVQQLIDMLDEPGSEKDTKPHYALHSVLNQTLIARDETMRREFCKVLAANLDSDLSDYNKGYLCQELQWAGHDEAVPALGELLSNEALVEPAAMALVAIGHGADAQLRAALPGAQGKCRLNILHALVAIGDRESKKELAAALTDLDREVRLAAGAGLAKIGDPDSVAALLKAADGDPGWERIQATKHCLVLAENLLAAGNKDAARKIYQHLAETRQDPSDARVQAVASKALGDI